MRLDRRHLFRAGARCLAALAVFRFGPRRVLGDVSQWAVRAATVADSEELAAIFNAHTAAGICPYADRVKPWAPADAAGYLLAFTGTRIVERHGKAVGFASVVDYDNPATTSRIEPDHVPEVGVIAFHPGLLAEDEFSEAAKYLAAAVAVQLEAMGFDRCRMRLPAHQIFESDLWFASHMEVRQVRRRNGVQHVRDVTFNVSSGLNALRAQGYGR